MNIHFKKKKGVSLVISWVLLIGLGVTLSMLFYQWAKAQAEESIKSAEEEVESGLMCENVGIAISNVEVAGSDININVSNTGYLSIDKVAVRTYRGDEPSAVVTKDAAIQPKDSAIITVTDNANRIEVVPLVNIDGKVASCPERTASSTF